MDICNLLICHHAQKNIIYICKIQFYNKNLPTAPFNLSRVTDRIPGSAELGGGQPPAADAGQYEQVLPGPGLRQEDVCWADHSRHDRDGGLRNMTDWGKHNFV